METLRKIELQEPEDLVYLINNVRAAATSQLNEAFPPVADSDGKGDELRLQIEREVNEVSWLFQPVSTLLGASHALSVGATISAIFPATTVRDTKHARPFPVDTGPS